MVSKDGVAMLTRMVRGECRCTALTGVIGKKVKCTIYERRPEICREYERGSFDCLSLNGIKTKEV